MKVAERPQTEDTLGGCCYSLGHNCTRRSRTKPAKLASVSISVLCILAIYRNLTEQGTSILTVLGPRSMTIFASATWNTVNRKYHQFLAIAVLSGRSRSYWDFHPRGLRRINYRISSMKLLPYVCMVVADGLLQPKRLLSGFRKRCLMRCRKFTVSD